MKEELNDIMQRYFAGEATPDEIAILEGWVKQNDANRNEFREASKVWNEIYRAQVNRNVDTEKELETVFQKMNDETPVVQLKRPETKKQSFAFSMLRIAAVLVILLGIGSVLYIRMSKPSMEHAVAENSGTLVILPDGSRVTLAQGTSIDYPETFSKKSREVTLSGKAYFEVAHNKEVPFRVNTSGAVVEVLGTEFNVVSANASGKMEVDLTKGKVAVYLKDNKQQSVELAPGERALLDPKDKSISRSQVSNENYMAWKTGNLRFENEPLSQVVAELSEAFNTPIQISSAGTGNCRLTASFSNQPLAGILNVISKTLNVNVSRSGSGFVVNGPTCNP